MNRQNPARDNGSGKPDEAQTHACEDQLLSSRKEGLPSPNAGHCQRD